jgi:hypothetical protein
MLGQGVIDSKDLDIINTEFEKFWKIPGVTQWFCLIAGVERGYHSDAIG